MNEAVELLYQNLGCLPSETFGPINMLPWAVDSDHTNALKREVCQAIINVLSDHGFIANPDDSTVRTVYTVNLNCRMCSKTLSAIAVDGETSNLPASSFITAIARLSPECPHEPVTADTQRRAIQEAVIAAQSQ